MHGEELISLINTAASIKSRQRKTLCCVAYRYKLIIIIPYQPVSRVEEVKKRRERETTRHFIARASRKNDHNQRICCRREDPRITIKHSAKRCSLCLGQRIIYDAISVAENNLLLGNRNRSILNQIRTLFSQRKMLELPYRSIDQME